MSWHDNHVHPIEIWEASDGKCDLIPHIDLDRCSTLPTGTPLDHLHLQRITEMKKAIVLAILLSVIGPAAGQGDGDRQAEEEMKRLNTQEVEALLRNDVTTLKRLWSDDFVVTNPFNKFIKKQQVVGMTESGKLAFASYDRELEYIRIYRDIAVVAGSEKVVWARKMPNAGQTSHLRFTAVWMKRSAGWQEIARHANIIVKQ